MDILPLVIIVLILICAYLEYQKNINMNNKVVICIICILTFVLCMGFVDKNRKREEGFQNEEIDIYNETSLINPEVKKKCDSKEKTLYDIITPNIKKDIETKKLLDNYLKRLENGEKECWKIPTYQKCRGIESKIILSKFLTKEEEDYVKNVCNNEKKCIEDNMINEYDDILKDYDIEGDKQIKNTAQKLSIKLKDNQGIDKDNDTLIDDIKRMIIKNMLNDITNRKSSSQMVEDVKQIIIKSKKDLCDKCELDNEICYPLDEDYATIDKKYKDKKYKDKKQKEAEKVAKEQAINQEDIKKKEQEKEQERKQAEKATKAQEKAAVTAAEKAAKEIITKENEEAYAEEDAETLRQKLEKIQQEKVNSKLNSSLISNLLGDNSETTTNSTTGTTTDTTTGATTDSTTGSTTDSMTYDSGNYNPSIENRLEARKQQRDKMYINPTSSGHIIDKYYSSLDNKPPGYSYIDPRLWTVPQKRPPICHYNNDLSAVPLYDSGTHINVLELTPYGDIATSERDVKQTNVGSILPEFQYREFS